MNCVIIDDKGDLLAYSDIILKGWKKKHFCQLVYMELMKSYRLEYIQLSF